jgi:hypothetical protein
LITVSVGELRRNQPFSADTVVRASHDPMPHLSFAISPPS